MVHLEMWRLTLPRGDDLPGVALPLVAQARTPGVVRRAVQASQFPGQILGENAVVRGATAASGPRSYRLRI